MLTRLDKNTLLKLAGENGIKADGRWSRERIIKALEKAGVRHEPVAVGNKLSAKIDQEPVRFRAKTGRIYVRDIPPPKITEYGSIERFGLIVDFGSGYGDEATLAGGYSREFYPDLDEHDELTNYCSCAQCLAEVRDWIAEDKHGIAARENIVEDTTANAPAVPLGNASAWAAISPDDLADLATKAGLDLENAMRWEKRNENRAAIIKRLDELAAAPVEPDAEDIATAELEV